MRPEGQGEHRGCKPTVHDEGQIHTTRPTLDDVCSSHHDAQGASLWLRPGSPGGGVKGPGVPLPTKETAGPHVWANESSSRPPFPRRYLARSFLVTSPTT